MPFQSVNRRGSIGYCKNMQRHHLLPRQLLRADYFGDLFETLGQARIGFNDFRANGLLLPASGSAALSSGLPLHRGPHRVYNELVAQRVGQVEASWSRARLRSPVLAREEALMRLGLIQRALRRRLLDRRACGFVLNRKDPFRTGIDFRELDAMAESLWSATSFAA
ncbi:AHH domain-containing protein [Aurantiacibacter marinus]|uniref:AHH domain-containing protein n=1 Tax=Aurantiacibacter marinus TaxID=874156 RepID=UPI0022B0B13D|nr:AHH domain-containing protein [Aurantiacibacter marinus]